MAKKRKKHGQEGPSKVLNKVRILIVTCTAMIVALTILSEKLIELKDTLFKKPDSVEIKKIEKTPSKLEPDPPIIEKGTKVSYPSNDDKVFVDKDKIRVLKTLPLYLTNTDFIKELDWFQFKAINKTNKTVLVSIKATSDSIAVKLIKDKWKYTISKKDSLIRKIRPKYNIFGKDASDRNKKQYDIELELSITDEGGKRLLLVDNYKIDVLRTNELTWDLKYLDGKEFSKEKLLASLSVWAETTDESIEHYSEKLFEYARKHASEANEPPVQAANHWFRKLYSEHLQGKRIKNSDFFLEPEGKLIIERPHKVYSNLEKNSTGEVIDTALMIGALSMRMVKGLKVPVVLLIVREKNRLAHIISWFLSTHGGKWYGINLLENDKPFEDNKDETTRKIAKILKDPNVLRSIKKKGTYYDKDNLIALNFNKAAEVFNIMGLP